MKRLISAAVIAASTFGLCGCFELSSRTSANPDGSLTIASDFGLDKAVAAEIGKIAGGGKPGDGATPGDFASMCKSGLDGALKEMQSALGPGAAKDVAPTQTSVPKGSGTVSERDGLLVCTFSITMRDPVGQYAEMAKISGIGGAVNSIELLPGGNGYRFKSSLKMADLTKEQTMSKEEQQQLAMMAGLIPREMTTSVTIMGLRIENSNGAVSADGKSVTWKMPLHKILDMRPEAEPLTMTADVYFK